MEKQIEQIKKSLQSTCDNLIKNIIENETKNIELQCQQQQAQILKTLNAEIIELNVGGVRYTAYSDTIKTQPEGLLSKILSGKQPIRKDRDGAIFIDRNGKYFEYVLDYLRDPSIKFPTDTYLRYRINKELEYFGLLSPKKTNESEIWTWDSSLCSPKLVLSDDYMTATSKLGYGAVIGKIDLRGKNVRWGIYIKDLANSYWLSIGITTASQFNNVDSFPYSSEKSLCSQSEVYNLEGPKPAPYLTQGQLIICSFDGELGVFTILLPDGKTYTAKNLNDQSYYPYLYLWQSPNSATLTFDFI